MINDLKLGLKILKYGLNAKGVILPLVLSLGLGVFLEIFMPIAPFSCMYIGMGAMLLIQLIHSVSVSNMVQTSTYKKRIQTIIPTLVGGVYLLIANTISILFKWIGYLRVANISDPDIIIIIEPNELPNAIIVSSIIMVFIMLYSGTAMKHFYLASIVFIGSFICFTNYMSELEIPMLDISTPVAILISYVIILAGMGIMYLIFCVSYKKEYSKATFETALKRAK